MNGEEGSIASAEDALRPPGLANSKNRLNAWCVSVKWGNVEEENPEFLRIERIKARHTQGYLTSFHNCHLA